LRQLFTSSFSRTDNSIRWTGIFILTVVLSLATKAQYNNQNDKKIWTGVSFSGLPISNHLLSGLNFELECYYSKRFAIGGGFSIAQGKTTQLDGFNYAHPSLNVGNIVLMNRFRIINNDNFQLTLFLKSGFEPIEISDDNRSLWSHLIFDAGRSKSDSSSRETNYLVLQPGIATAFRLFSSQTNFTTEFSYRFLDGESKFGSSTYFSGFEISLGFYFDTN
jgi:hypothetical protein